MAGGFLNRQVLDTTAKAGAVSRENGATSTEGKAASAVSQAASKAKVRAVCPRPRTMALSRTRRIAFFGHEAGSRLSQSAAAKNYRPRRVDAPSKPAFDSSSNKVSCGCTMPSPIQLSRIFPKVVAQFQGKDLSGGGAVDWTTRGALWTTGMRAGCRSAVGRAGPVVREVPSWTARQERAIIA